MNLLSKKEILAKEDQISARDFLNSRVWQTELNGQFRAVMHMGKVKRIPSLRSEDAGKEDYVAKTNGYVVWLNNSNSMFEDLMETYETSSTTPGAKIGRKRFHALLRDCRRLAFGLCFHEGMHVMYTPFDLIARDMERMDSGLDFMLESIRAKDMPEAQENLKDMQTFYSDSFGPSVFQRIWHDVHNSVEDGYIEEAGMAAFHGRMVSGLYWVRQMQFDSFPKLEKMLAEADERILSGQSSFEEERMTLAMNTLLEYAKYGRISADSQSSLQHPILDGLKKAIPYIHQALLSANSQDRMSQIHAAFVMLWPVFAKPLSEAVETAKENNSVPVIEIDMPAKALSNMNSNASGMPQLDGPSIKTIINGRLPKGMKASGDTEQESSRKKTDMILKINVIEDGTEMEDEPETQNKNGESSGSDSQQGSESDGSRSGDGETSSAPGQSPANQTSGETNGASEGKGGRSSETEKSGANDSQNSSSGSTGQKEETGEDASKTGSQSSETNGSSAQEDEKPETGHSADSLKTDGSSEEGKGSKAKGASGDKDSDKDQSGKSADADESKGQKGRGSQASSSRQKRTPFDNDAWGQDPVTAPQSAPQAGSKNSSSMDSGAGEEEQVWNSNESSGNPLAKQTGEGERINENTQGVVGQGEGGTETRVDHEPLDAGTADVETLLRQMAQKAAEEAAEESRTRDLNNEVSGMNLGENHRGVSVVIHRQTAVDPELQEICKEEFAPLSLLAKQASRRLKTVLKKARNGDKERNLLIGKRLDTKRLYKPDSRYWTRNSRPRHTSVCFGVLVDESGSMSGTRSEMARASAILLYDICRELDIPICVYGHTYGGDVDLFSYAEFDSVDAYDRCRMRDIGARWCNRDGAALAYMFHKMEKRPEEQKILFIISDGQPNADSYGGASAIRDMQQIVKTYGRKGIYTIAAAIGEDKDAIESIYGDGFMDITNLEKLPEILARKLLKFIRAR